MKNFIIRLLTGVIYAGAIISGVIFSPYTFLALFIIITPICLWEFYRLVNVHEETKINPYIHGIGGAILFLAAFLYASGLAGRYIFSSYLLYIIGTFIYELYANQKKPIRRLACIFLGQYYIALPFSVLNLLAFPVLGTDSNVYQWIWIFALFLFIWANDCGAYLIGVKFGKHRLWERISPNKTWEGFFGGLVFAIIAAFIFAHFHPQIASYHWIALSIGVVIFSTYGDLVESLIKRTLDIKDSGHSLPGHGGFLDRFDSMLLAIYAVLFYLLCTC